MKFTVGSGAPTDDFMDLQYTSKEEGKRSIDSWHSRQRIMRPKLARNLPNESISLVFAINFSLLKTHPVETPGNTPQRFSFASLE